MRLSNAQAVARPQFFDRNPVPKGQRYIATVGPHAGTTRWSYTVPAGKKAWMDAAVAFVQRQTAAAPVGPVFAWVRYTPAAGTAVTIVTAQIATNGLLDFNTSQLSQLGAMMPGDLVEGLTSDGSTGGTITFDVNLKYTEFDA